MKTLLKKQRITGSSNTSFTKKERIRFMTLLAELLDNGFHLQDGLSFLMVTMPKQQPIIKQMKRSLTKGMPLSQVLRQVGLTESQIAQISFSDVHGQLSETLLRMVEQMTDTERNRQTLIKLGTYPCLLLLFLFGMIGGMKRYVLPELNGIYETDTSQSFGVVVIENGPLILLSLLLVVIAVLGMMKWLKRHNNPLTLINKYSRLPIAGPLVKGYYTSLFAIEWGYLLSQGLEIRDVILVMNRKGYSPLMKEMAKDVERELEKGHELDVALKGWAFLLPELRIIIKRGEIKGNLGKELVIYGKKVWEDFVLGMEKYIRWLQPILFLIIAILIVSVYAALLLPIYGNMGGFDY